MSNDVCRVIAVLVACCIILFVLISRIISSTKETVYLVEKEQELSTYLQEIADWDSLCTNLGVDKAIMANLQMGTQKDHLKKKECLANYFESGRAKWNDIVKVVAKFPFFKKALACRIAERFMNMDRDYCLDQYLLPKDEF